MNDEDRPVRKPFAFGLFDYAQLPLFSVLFLGLGVVVGVYMLPEQWSLFNRIAAGVALGLAAVLSFFANRMIGGRDFD